ncbi:unnamed protein product [Amoebophrya sp. A25]|nr:unnamed protein product [Amoebophrya sp. A25]|eukprot:GSA25T00015109001.1
MDADDCMSAGGGGAGVLPPRRTCLLSEGAHGVEPGLVPSYVECVKRALVAFTAGHGTIPDQLDDAVVISGLKELGQEREMDETALRQLNDIIERMQTFGENANASPAQTVLDNLHKNYTTMEVVDEEVVLTDEEVLNEKLSPLEEASNVAASGDDAATTTDPHPVGAAKDPLLEVVPENVEAVAASHGDCGSAGSPPRSTKFTSDVLSTAAPPSSVQAPFSTGSAEREQLFANGLTKEQATVLLRRSITPTSLDFIDEDHQRSMFASCASMPDISCLALEEPRLTTADSSFPQNMDGEGSSRMNSLVEVPGSATAKRSVASGGFPSPPTKRNKEAPVFSPQFRTASGHQPTLAFKAIAVPNRSLQAATDEDGLMNSSGELQRPAALSPMESILLEANDDAVMVSTSSSMKSGDKGHQLCSTSSNSLAAVPQPPAGFVSLAAMPPSDKWRTGLSAHLDEELLQGGFSAGQLVEVFGEAGSGKTAFLAAIAAAEAQRQRPCYVLDGATAGQLLRRLEATVGSQGNAGPVPASAAFSLVQQQQQGGLNFVRYQRVHNGADLLRAIGAVRADAGRTKFANTSKTTPGSTTTGKNAARLVMVENFVETLRREDGRSQLVDRATKELQDLADSLDLTVLISNGVRTDFSKASAGVGAEDAVALGGEALAARTHTQLRLTKKIGLREIRLVKESDSAGVTATDGGARTGLLEVTDQGVVVRAAGGD